MADAKGKAKEALGWATADRDAEAEGLAEQEASGKPTDDELARKKDEVRTRYGETDDGSDAPDSGNRIAGRGPSTGGASGRSP